METFIKAWKELTVLIRKHEGSLGSRLHRSDDFHFIAYAQWPDRNTWENYGKNLPVSSKELSNKMKDSCQSIKTLYKLEVIEDLLVS